MITHHVAVVAFWACVIVVSLISLALALMALLRVRREYATSMEQMLAEHRATRMGVIDQHELDCEELNLTYGKPVGYRLRGAKTRAQRIAEFEADLSYMRRVFRR